MLSKMFDFQQAEASTLSNVLSGLSAGVFLVDAGARIMYLANDRVADRALRDSLAIIGNEDETQFGAGDHHHDWLSYARIG
jgi:hypothetical protein